jgi:hypothetical protein
VFQYVSNYYPLLNISGRPSSTKSSPSNDPRNKFTREDKIDQAASAVELFPADMLDVDGNLPDPPLWMHLSTKTDPNKVNGYFVYSSDEYEE